MPLWKRNASTVATTTPTSFGSKKQQWEDMIDADKIDNYYEANLLNNNSKDSSNPEHEKFPAAAPSPVPCSPGSPECLAEFEDEGEDSDSGRTGKSKEHFDHFLAAPWTWNNCKTKLLRVQLCARLKLHEALQQASAASLPSQSWVDHPRQNSHYYGLVHLLSCGCMCSNHSNLNDRKKNDDTDQSSPSPSSSSLSLQPSRCRRYSLLLLILWIELPLALLWGSALTIGAGIPEIHKDYYQPLYDRAHRTDEHLAEEYTYYNRHCTLNDVSTQTLSDLQAQPPPATAAGNDYNQVAKPWVNTVMTHGALFVPTLLSQKVTQDLLKYVRWRNHHTAKEEQYPVSQGRKRISYGIDHSEHPAVSAAVREIATHPILLPTLQSLLGDVDPASTELTAITAYPGSGPQAWHMDTKIDGNAVLFARTFSHSYSLFVPLQDITATMGATDLCPGTHYCAGDQSGMSEMCNKHGVRGLHQVSTNDKGQQVFPAGSGALLNQHVWHRGAAHTGKHEPERIVFIMSFLARPQRDEHHELHDNSNSDFGTTSRHDHAVDPRQLSRGTYFHQRWNMWGQTIQDLQQAGSFWTQWPFSVLRCLRLWKRKGAHWGYDLVTATFLRFSNTQLEDNDLSEKLGHKLDMLHFPQSLRGDVVEDPYEYDEEDEPPSQKDQWNRFLTETFDKTGAAVWRVTIRAHMIYALCLVFYWCLVNRRRKRKRATSVATITKGYRHRKVNHNAVSRSSSRAVSSAVKRLLVTHTLVAGWYLLRRDQLLQSPWAKRVRTGAYLMRPFPPTAEKVTVAEAAHEDYDYDDEEETRPKNFKTSSTSRTASSTNTTAIPKHSAGSRPSTLPQRHDVLFGTRYDAAFLGAYDSWLDYHPGNVVFQSAVDQLAPSYQSYMTTTTISDHNAEAEVAIKAQAHQLHNGVRSKNHVASTKIGSSLPKSLGKIMIKSNQLSPSFAHEVVRNVFDSIHKDQPPSGRFLQQEWQTGVWRALTPTDTFKTIRRALRVASGPPVLAVLEETVRYQLAHSRFSFARGTALSRHSQQYLSEFEDRLLLSNISDRDKGVITTAPSLLPSFSLIETKLKEVPKHKIKYDPANARFTLPLHSAQFPHASSTQYPVGSLVKGYFPDERTWYAGSILSVHEPSKKEPEEEVHAPKYKISFEDGTIETIEEEFITLDHPVVEGRAVYGCQTPPNQRRRKQRRRKSQPDCWLGVIQSVHPSGAIDFAFYDTTGEKNEGSGKLEVVRGLPENQYYLPPPDPEVQMRKEGDGKKNRGFPNKS